VCVPFSIKIHLGTEHPVTFEKWLDGAFGQYLPKGTPFALAKDPNGSGSIVTNGPMVLSSKVDLVPGSILRSGDCVAYGAADGDEIPYGKPYCIFVPIIT
jgi:hypothetical protein